MVSKIQLPIGGLWANCYGVDELLASKQTKKTALCLFFLHGRFGSAERIEHIVEKTYHDVLAQDGLDKRDSDVDKAKKHLIIITFDQRNHGTRKISAKGQQAWNEGNLKHAQDMLAMLVGTAHDVSFLADYLPSFLFSNNEVEIIDWAVTGISLGGHSVWHVLKNDSRFKIGVPMLGCPSYRVLMQHRAGVNNLPYEPPYMPTTLLTLLNRIDPDSAAYSSTDPAQNPFLGKKILILAGEVDELVPWECGRKFVEGLEVGSEGEKKVCIEPGRGHETSNYMIGELVEWIIMYGL